MNIVTPLENPFHNPYDGKLTSNFKIEFNSREEYDKFLSDNVYNLIPSDKNTITIDPIWEKWAKALFDINIEYDRDIKDARNELLTELEKNRATNPPITPEETTKEYFDMIFSIKQNDEKVISQKEDKEECNPIENLEVE